MHNWDTITIFGSVCRIKCNGTELFANSCGAHIALLLCNIYLCNKIGMKTNFTLTVPSIFTTNDIHYNTKSSFRGVVEP